MYVDVGGGGDYHRSGVDCSTETKVSHHVTGQRHGLKGKSRAKIKQSTLLESFMGTMRWS